MAGMIAIFGFGMLFYDYTIRKYEEWYPYTSIKDERWNQPMEENLETLERSETLKYWDRLIPKQEKENIRVNIHSVNWWWRYDLNIYAVHQCNLLQYIVYLSEYITMSSKPFIFTYCHVWWYMMSNKVSRNSDYELLCHMQYVIPTLKRAKKMQPWE